MFTKKITDADEFMSLPSSAQALYLHLCMSADDDGFNNQIQLAMFKAHASIDDVKVLLAKRYIIQFDTGVIVIKHWRMANALRKDRYNPTNYQEELKQLKIKKNGAYTLGDEEEWLPSGCQVSAKCLPQDRLGKDRLDKVSLGEDKEYIPDQSEEPETKSEKKTRHKHGEYGHVLLTDDQYQKLIDEYGGIATEQAIKKVDEYCEEKGKTYKNYYLTLKKWGYDSDKKTTGNTYVDAINNRITQMKDW